VRPSELEAKIDALANQPEFEEKYSIVYNELLRQESLLDALAKPKPTDPVAWTKQNRILKGERFSFEDRDYLLPLYRDSSHRIIIVKARQMEMTEWIVNWLLHKLVSNLTRPPSTPLHEWIRFQDSAMTDSERRS